MATKRKGLGKGLEALLGADTASSSLQKGDQLSELPVEFIQRGKYQPRREMDADSLQELAESIKSQGLIQPIIVRSISNNRYEIIAGERRWRAVQLAGLGKIPVVIRNVDDSAAIAMALIENIQREDLNPIDEAVALKRLQEEFELSHQQIADSVGKSRTSVTNSLRLLSLSDDVKQLLERGDIEMGHARAMLSLSADEQKVIALQVVNNGLSVRQTEALVRQGQQPKPAKKAEANNNSDIHRLQEGLAEKVGVPVQLRQNAKGAGKLVFSYNSLDELDGILAHLDYQPL